MLNMMTDVVRIRRPGGTTTSSTGVVIDVWATIADNVRAAVQARSAIYREVVAGQEEQSTYVAFFMPTVDVRELDEVATLNTDGSVRQVYLVTFVRNVRGHHLEVDLHSVDE